MKKKASSSKNTVQNQNLKKVYLSIVEDYEKQKNLIVKAYLDKLQKIKKRGVQKLESALAAEEEKSVNKMMQDL